MRPSMPGLAMVSAVALFAAGQAEAATATKSTFGTLPDGRTVGVTTRIIALGAAIQSLVMPAPRSGRGFELWSNQPTFPSARLEPGQPYHNIIIYKLSSGTPAR